MGKFDIFKFPTGKDRKKVIENNSAAIEKFKVVGEKKINQESHYTWVDSPVDGFEDDLTGMPFSLSFKDLLPHLETSLRNYIENILEEKKGKAVGVEFGGIGSRFFAGFSEGFFEKSFGVTLVDHRKSSHNFSILVEEDKQNHHEVIEGDIFDFKTYETLEKSLGHHKVDLIVERMGRGLEFVPIEPYTVAKVLNTWYELLDEGGMMFVQVPFEFSRLLEAWAHKIENDFKGKLEIKFSKANERSKRSYGAFSLRKFSRAPKEMPFLDSKEVQDAGKFV